MRRNTRKMSSRGSRHAERNVALSSIREMLRSSASSNRYSPFSRTTTPRRSPSTPRNEPLQPVDSPVFTLTPRESPELQAKVANIQPLEANPLNESKQNIQEVNKREVTPEAPQEAAATPLKYKELLQNGIQYVMLPIHLLQFCIWGTDSGAILPAIDLKKHVSGDSPAPKVEDKSPEDGKLTRSPPLPAASACAVEKPLEMKTPVKYVHKTPEENLKIYQHQDQLDLSSSDESSDEMVTADECLSSSPRKYSTASSNGHLMNMSVDFANNNSEKHMNLNLLEEPMEVTADDSNSCIKSPPRQVKTPLRTQGTPRSIMAKVEYSSASGSDVEWSERQSSDDSEIARIFAGSCTSSSSDDEEYTGTPMMMRRKLEPSPRTPSKRRPLRKKESPLARTPGRMPRNRAPSLPDSAYSDGEAPAVMPFHQTHLPAPSYPAVESMDQDYGADNEDSNDGFALEPRKLSYDLSPIRENSKNIVSNTPARRRLTPGAYSTGSSGFEERHEELAQHDGLQRCSEAFALDKSMLHLQIARNLQLNQQTVCSCSTPAWYPVPIGVSMASGNTSLENFQQNYPPAPTPLPHMYYQYPEFMNRPMVGQDEEIQDPRYRNVPKNVEMLFKAYADAHNAHNVVNPVSHDFSQNFAQNRPYNAHNVANPFSHDFSQNFAQNVPYNAHNIANPVSHDFSENFAQNVPYNAHNVANPFSHDFSENFAQNVPYNVAQNGGYSVAQIIPHNVAQNVPHHVYTPTYDMYYQYLV